MSDDTNASCPCWSLSAVHPTRELCRANRAEFRDAHCRGLTSRCGYPLARTAWEMARPPRWMCEPPASIVVKLARRYG